MTYVLAAQFDKLFIGILPMSAYRDDDGDVIIGYAFLVEEFGEEGQGICISLPSPGDVANGYGHPISGFDEFSQGRAVDGMIQCVEIRSRQIFRRFTVSPL